MFLVIQVLSLFVIFFFAIKDINNKYIKISISTFFSLFINLQILSLLLINNIFNYEFFININIEGLQKYLNDFTFYVIFLFISFVSITFLFYKNFFIKKYNLSIIFSSICIIIIMSFLYFPNGSIIKGLFTINQSINVDISRNVEDILSDLDLSNDLFITPDKLNVEPGKNIIVISLESLESAFVDKNEKKLTPFLNSFKNNFSYVEMDQIASWTAGSLYTLMTGIPPYFMKDDLNSQFYGVKDILFTNLSDVLNKGGYTQKYFMSDVDFAGTDFFLKALNFEISSNVNKLEDSKFFTSNDSDLFIELKREIKKNNKNKFAFFVSTINTHFPSGIYDNKVSKFHHKKINDFESKLDFQIFSTDFLLKDLYKFLKEENLLDKTAVYIFPDHLMMGNQLSDLIHTKRSLYLMSNQDLSNLNGISQLDLPRIIIDKSGIKSNAVFLSDFNIKKFDFNSIASLNYKNLIKDNLSDLVINYENEYLSISYGDFFQKFRIDYNTKFLKLVFNSNLNIIDSNKEFYNFLPENNKYENIYRPIEAVIFFNNNTFKNLLITNNGNINQEYTPNHNGNIILTADELAKINKKNNINFISYNYFQLIGNLKIYFSKFKDKYLKKNYFYQENIYDEQTLNFKFPYIAHAGGMINNDVYTNSLESLNNSYKNGFRYFELDLHLTSDNKIVAVHDWNEWALSVNYSGSLPPKYEDFINLKYLGKYTPLDMDSINRWFDEHRDAILVTDKIEDIFLVTNKFLDKKRLVMEVFTFESLVDALSEDILEVLPNIKLWKKIRKEKYRKQINFNKIKNISLPIDYKKTQYLEEINNSNIGFYFYNLPKNKKEINSYLCSKTSFFSKVYIDSTDIKDITCE